MLDPLNIKQLDFDCNDNIMIVHLDNAVNYKGYMTNTVKYRMPYDKYLEKVQEWRKLHKK